MREENKIDKNMESHDENEGFHVMKYNDNVTEDFSYNFSNSEESPIHPNDIFVARNRRRWEEEKAIKRRAISKKLKMLLICVCGMIIVAGTFCGVKKMQSELLERKWEEQVRKSYQCLENLGEYSFFIPDMDYFLEVYETSSKYERDSKDYFSRAKQPQGVSWGEEAYVAFYDTIMEVKEKWGLSIIAFDTRNVMELEDGSTLFTYNLDLTNEDILSLPYFELEEGTSFQEDEIYVLSNGKLEVGSYLEAVDHEGKMHQFKVAGRMKNDFYPTGLMVDATSGFASFSSPEFYLINPNSTYIKNLDTANYITTLLVKIPEENKIFAMEEMKKYGRFEELNIDKFSK